MSRKQLVAVVLIAFVIGAFGSVFFNRVIFPNLSTVRGFSWVSKLQSSAPIVISRREEVRLNEGVNLIELTKQAQTAVVSIYAPTGQKFMGNGVIVTSDGVILTAKEVVGTSADVRVVMNDSTIYAGKVSALDPKSSLAVIKVAAEDLPVAQFSDAGNMQTAQRVFAVGRTNLSFTREFASGLVTKTLANNVDSERVLNSDIFENTISSDARLNGDFVGGPLVNLQGTLVGMVVSSAGAVLPSEAIEGALKSYLEQGKIVRPYYGIKYSMLTQVSSKLVGAPVTGARIVELEAAGAGAKAGLRVGDIVTAVDGQSVSDSSFEQLMSNKDLSQSTFRVRRDNSDIELTVKPDAK